MQLLVAFHLLDAPPGHHWCSYLKPVLQDDALLFGFDDGESDDEENAVPVSEDKLRSENALLRAKIEDMHSSLGTVNSTLAMCAPLPRFTMHQPFDLPDERNNDASEFPR